MSFHLLTHLPQPTTASQPICPKGKNHVLDEWNLESLSKLGCSNYQSFLSERVNYTEYPLPDTFKLLQIVDRTHQPIKGQYQWFNFSILSYSCRQLCEVAIKMIKSCEFQKYCATHQIERLVQTICLNYNQVSYHNFSHAFSLMHMFYQLTKIEPKFKKICTNEELGYVLVAALAHDLNHPGTNNGYETKIKSELAIQANYEAILEKMHIKHFFTLLKNLELDIFEKSENPQKMKKLVISAILSTDVTQHFKNLQKLKVLLSSHQTTSLEDEQRHFCLEQVFHACDIGNPCLQFQEYINWASLLSYEFNTQTILQQQKNVQISEMLRFKSLSGFYQGQIGFINYLVYPLWKELSNTWTGFQLLVENIQTNLKLLELKSKNQKQ